MRCCAPRGFSVAAASPRRTSRVTTSASASMVSKPRDASLIDILRAHRRGARRRHADVLRIQRAGGARSIPHARASTWRCSKSGSAAGWMPPTSSTRTSAVVCSIGLDHVDWLGHTLEAIGREKAGIFRNGRPAVLGSADMPDSLWSAIEEIGARAVVPGPRLSATCAREAGWDFEYGDLLLRDLPMPSLTGVHQMAMPPPRWRRCRGRRCEAHARRSPARRCGPCSSQAGSSGYVPARVEWIFDVAHNVPAAQGLAVESARVAAARGRSRCAAFLATRTSRESPRLLAP